MHKEIKRYFQLQDLPFEQTPNLKFFCDFELYRDAAEAILQSLEKGDYQSDRRSRNGQNFVVSKIN